MKTKQNIFYPLAGIAVFILIWQVLSKYIISKSWLLPTPGQVLSSFGANVGLIWDHSLYTLAEAGLGLLLSAVLSMIFALLMSLLPAVRKTLYPLLLLVSQMIPIIVLAPLFIIWFGYGILPKILVVILICFFPMTINILSGLAATDSETAAFFRAMGMNGSQLFRMVILPNALPYFFSGLRISAVYSVMGAVIGEWLGATAGLGLLIIRAQNSFQIDLVFAGILAIIFWSALLFWAVKAAEAKLLSWQKYQSGDKWESLPPYAENISGDV